MLPGGRRRHAAVYAVVYKPEPEAKPDRYAVIYVDHADDLSAEHLPFNHPRAALLGAARRRPLEALHLHLRGAGGLRSHREQIAHELIAVYRPSCNAEQYDPAWKDEWIGEYTRAHRRPPHDRPRPVRRLEAIATSGPEAIPNASVRIASGLARSDASGHVPTAVSGSRPRAAAARRRLAVRPSGSAGAGS